MFKERDTLLKGKLDTRIQNECLLASALLKEFPDLTRAQALREASRILEIREGAQ